MSIKSRLKELVRRYGFDVIRFTPRSSPVARRIQLFRHYGIDLVLDVGASTGGYAAELRTTGYRNRIVSFEPSSKAFPTLKQRASADPQWSAVPLALGDESGQHTLHLSRNCESSSFLPIRPRHTAAYPDAAYVGSEIVTIRRLDEIYATYSTMDARTFLKLDVQGYEKRVLLGAEASLPHITGVQVELSLVPLYESEPSFLDLITYLQAHGLTLMSLQPVINDPVTGQLLQVDGLFFRSDV